MSLVGFENMGFDLVESLSNFIYSLRNRVSPYLVVDPSAFTDQDHHVN
jgi:hypothetical protein